MRYVNQRLGFQCFTETLFEDAGNRFYEGELDPRVLISYYPELRGNLFAEDDTVDVMAGVAEYMPQEDSVDDISECPVAPRLDYDSICAIYFALCPREPTLHGRNSPTPRRACDGRRVEVQEGPQLAQQSRHPARVVEVRHVVRPAGFQVHERRRLAPDLVDGV